jgi:TonB family protein
LFETNITEIWNWMKSTLDHLLNDRPDGGRKWLMNVLLFALGLQTFVFAIVFFTTANPLAAWEYPDQAVLEQEIPLQLETEESSTGEGANGDSPKNVIGNAMGPAGDVIADYSGIHHSNGAMSAQEYARQEQERIREQHVDDPKPIRRDYTPQADPLQRSTTTSSNTSYAGAVSATWSLKDRNVLLSPKPTYRCKQAGTVKVNIEVDQAGTVKSVQIDPSSSNVECLRNESLVHAKKWKFNASLGTKTQQGSIVFQFAAQ